MPSGRKPKVYEQAIVDVVRTMYSNMNTQTEIANQIGLSQKIVWNIMRRHGISARVPKKRDQKGQKNSSWKGDLVGYQAFHVRVYAIRGRPQKCVRCGTDDPQRTFHWANLTGNYSDVNDFASMCVPCHKRYDLDRRLEIAK